MIYLVYMKMSTADKVYDTVMVVWRQEPNATNHISLLSLSICVGFHWKWTNLSLIKLIEYKNHNFNLQIETSFQLETGTEPEERISADHSIFIVELQYLYNVTSLCHYSFNKNLSSSITLFLENPTPRFPISSRLCGKHGSNVHKQTQFDIKSVANFYVTACYLFREEMCVLTSIIKLNWKISRLKGIQLCRLQSEEWPMCQSLVNCMLLHIKVIGAKIRRTHAQHC